ncbi:MAG: hypothetical protein ACRDQX_09240 [Pseudonocardiaceae bacterium]
MPLPLDSIPLHDAEGALVPLQSRVEQITVDHKHGALPNRLHHTALVIGRDFDRICVVFDIGRIGQQVLWLRPHLVRVIETPNYRY